MNKENYELLEDVFHDLQQERNDLQKQIDNNLEKIQEIECYLQSLYDNEDNHYKMFSPRNVENIYKDEIESNKNEIVSYQKKNVQLYHDLNKITTKVEHMEKVLKDEEANLSSVSLTDKNFSALNIQEADRQRIARDLHDTSLQNLSHLVHKIELSSMYIDQDPIRAKLELSVVTKNLREIIEEIRNTIFDLRPMTFDDLGLRDTFERLLFVINENNKYEMDIDIQDVSCENNMILLTIYRVVQESLYNIVKHAEADKIFFHCRQEKSTCVIDIKDNGKGFSEEDIETKSEKHFGMAVLKERIKLLGGTVTINSNINKGTQIHMEIPL